MFSLSFAHEGVTEREGVRVRATRADQHLFEHRSAQGIEHRAGG